MTLQKPAHIAENPIMSQKWDEITEGRNFSPINATTIAFGTRCFARVRKTSL